jgi:hypothetical protein
MRAFVLCGVVAVVAVVVVVSPATARSGRVGCPLQPGVPSGGDVQWAFSDSGRPDGDTVRTSYAHGRGSWTGGRATGTVCITDSPTNQGGGVRDVVLAVRGASGLAGRVTQGGLLGVRMVLRVKVRASDDRSCATGASGTVTLFASYFSVHRDTMRTHFGSRCTGHNLDYSGSALHVYIARQGAQVNAP